jgi:hypothetical protein
MICRLIGLVLVVPIGHTPLFIYEGGLDPFLGGSQQISARVRPSGRTLLVFKKFLTCIDVIPARTLIS